MACRFKMYQGNGSTCPRARIRSSLILVKVRTGPLLLSSIFMWGIVLIPAPTSQRIRKVHPRPRTGDIASCASPCCRYLPAVFNSILPEPCAGRAAQRACATMCVLSLDSPFDAHKETFCFPSLAYAVGQSLLRCSSSKGIVASSARKRVSESAPSCEAADAM